MFSCQKDYPVEYTETYEMAREWFVTNKQGDTNIDAVRKLITYNTASNVNTEMWIDASALAASPFKIKSNINYTEKTFTPGTYKSILNDKDVKVISGKVTPKGGKTKTGVTVDAISLKVEIDGNEYLIEGHQRSGFLEDEF